MRKRLSDGKDTDQRIYPKVAIKKYGVYAMVAKRVVMSDIAIRINYVVVAVESEKNITYMEKRGL